MRVSEIDVHDDAAVTAWWDVSRIAGAFEREALATQWSLRAATVALRAENNPVKQVPLAAYDDGDEIVGVNQLHYPLLDNTHLAYVDARVLPDHRRRGVGTALLEASIDLARAAGRTTILCELNLPLDDAVESPNLTFARKHGFEVAILDLHRVLELPVDPDLLDALEQESAPRHEHFELVTWVDNVVPDEHLAGYCRLQNAFNLEAPSGELELEEEAWDEERVRNAEKRYSAQGRVEAVTAALDPDGELVGLTEMMSTAETQEFAWQGGTLVLKSARGHRLGMAMKVANLRRFQAMLPACRMVHSWNAEENGPMVAINDRLGFRPVERLAEMQRKIVSASTS